MITITVTPGIAKPTATRSAPDHAWREWDGQRFEAHAFSATTELTRMLVNAGCPDQPWESFVGQPRSLFGPSLHPWAGKVATESRGRGIGMRPYTGHAASDATELC